jgi:hypothetical protein
LFEVVNVVVLDNSVFGFDADLIHHPGITVNDSNRISFRGDVRSPQPLQQTVNGINLGMAVRFLKRMPGTYIPALPPFPCPLVYEGSDDTGGNFNLVTYFFRTTPGGRPTVFGEASINDFGNP